MAQQWFDNGSTMARLNSDKTPTQLRQNPYSTPMKVDVFRIQFGQALPTIIYVRSTIFHNLPKINIESKTFATLPSKTHAADRMQMVKKYVEISMQKNTMAISNLGFQIFRKKVHQLAIKSCKCQKICLSLQHR